MIPSKNNLKPLGLRNIIKRVERWILCSIFAIGLPCSVATEQQVASSTYSLVLNPDIKMSNFKRRDLRTIFTLKRSIWPNGTSIQIVVFKSDSPVHNGFVEKELGLFNYQVERIWKRQIFSGSGKSPIEVNDVNEMISTVAQTPGAIGYIKLKSVKDSNNETVTIIALDK